MTVGLTRIVGLTQTIELTRTIGLTRTIELTRTIGLTRTIALTRTIGLTRTIELTRTIRLTRIIRKPPDSPSLPSSFSTLALTLLTSASALLDSSRRGTTNVSMQVGVESCRFACKTFLLLRPAPRLDSPPTGELAPTQMSSSH